MPKSQEKVVEDILEIEKEFLCPPGLTIQETLDAISMSLSELAVRICMPIEKVDELISGKTRLTQDIANLLEQALGIPSSFWLNMECDYRKSLQKYNKHKRKGN